MSAAAPEITKASILAETDAGTILHSAVRARNLGRIREIIEFAESQGNEILNLTLKARYPDKWLSSNKMWSAVHFAIASRDEAVFDLVLSFVHKVANLRDRMLLIEQKTGNGIRRGGQSPLMLLIELWPSISVAEKLRLAGAKMDTTEMHGYTLAEACILENCVDLLQYFLSNGARLRADLLHVFSDKPISVPMLAAIKAHNPALLETRKENLTPLLAAAKAGNEGHVRILISAGADLTATTSTGQTFSDLLSIARAAAAAPPDTTAAPCPVFPLSGGARSTRPAADKDVDEEAEARGRKK